MSREIADRYEIHTIVADTTLTVPGGETSYVVTGEDIDIGGYSTGIILIHAGTETATATLDVKFQVKDSMGNYHDHTSATQVTAAGNSSKTIATLDGAVGRIIVTLGDAAADAFAHVNVDFIVKM